VLHIVIAASPAFVDMRLAGALVLFISVHIFGQLNERAVR